MEANAEITQQGELTTSDYFILLEKTLLMLIISRLPFCSDQVYVTLNVGVTLVGRNTGLFFFRTAPRH